MKSNPRVVAAFVLFVLLAAGIRLTYLLQTGESLVGRLVILDSAIYQGRALEILNGQIVPTEVFRMSPAYSYFMAAIYWLSGTEQPNVVRLWQALLGAIGCGLTYLLGRRLVGGRTGVIAGISYLLCGPLVFTEGLIVTESSLCFFHLLFLMLLVIALERTSFLFSIFTGLVFGFAATFRGNVLLYVLPLAVFFVLSRSENRRQRLLQVALPLFIGAAIPILVVTAANYHAEKDLVLLSSNAGFNFYIGNHPKSSGIFDKIEGHDESRGFDSLKDLDGRDFARAITGKNLSPSEASNFWFRATLDSASGRWCDFAFRLLRKCVLFLGAREIPQIYSYTVAREESFLLRILPLSFAIMIPFGLFGLFMAFREGGEYRLVAALFTFYVASIAMFFVVGRYRIALTPLLFVFSGAALSYAVETVKERNWRHLTAFIILVSVFAILPIATTQPHEKRMEISHFAKLYATSGETGAARQILERGIERYPEDGRLYAMMGDIDLSEGDLGRAIRDYSRATEVPEPDVGDFIKLAGALATAGKTDAAIVAIDGGLRLYPDNVDCLIIMADLLQRRGEIDTAIRVLEKAHSLAPDVTEIDRAMRDMRRLQSGEDGSPN
ncbi:MAG: glycosyltransferase family 39 protein [Candidatus Coatesbacteria bacterium]|nr:glycosyltransferase family 39 protein [Candidatus Coatesbacteria bacterium]